MFMFYLQINNDEIESDKRNSTYFLRYKKVYLIGRRI